MDDKKPTSSTGASRAELAREKRKAQIEEEAKKQAAKEAEKAGKKRMSKWAKIGTTVLVIVLALLIFLFSFFGVFDRQAKAIKYKDGSHTKISAAEYEYYYRMYYNYYANLSQQYEQQYGQYFGDGAGVTMTGFDYTKTPAEQEFKNPQGQSEDLPKEYGKNPTWADYFEYKAIQDSEANNKVYKIAEEAGYKLTKDEQKELDDFMKELQESAEQNEYSLDAFLRSNYGKGMTKSLFEKIYTKQTVAQDYLNDKKEAFAKTVTKDEINAEYKKNQKNYTKINVRYFQIAENMADSKAKELTDAQKKKINDTNKKKADAFVKQATNANFAQLASDNSEGDEKTSILSDASYTTLKDTTYDSLTSYVNKEAAEWAFAKTTKVGDCNVFTKTDDNGLNSYAIVLVASEQTRDETVPVAVRHILVKSGTDSSTGEEIRSDEAAKKLADNILKKYQDGEQTEEAFAALAEKYTEDDGSKTTGGLYDDVTSESQYMDEFKNWALAGHSKGDVAIIKTDYGYHIMYYVGNSEYPVWGNDVKDAITDQKYDAWYKKAVNADEAKVSNHWKKKVRKRVNKSAETLVSNLSSQNQQAQSYIG